MLIHVDSREPKQNYNFLVSAFPRHTFEVKALKEGDYATERVLVERKTINDLYGSIMGAGKGSPGRLGNQVGRMACHDNQVVCILIIGSISTFVEEIRKEAHVTVNTDVIYGQLASIACRERIHLIWMEKEWDALVAMVKFMQKVEEGKYMVPSKRDPDMLTARLLGITPTQWKHLKLKFGSLARIAQATDQELSTVYGIGKAKAKKIRELLNKGW